MLNLHDTGASITREERALINENWLRISNAFSSLNQKFNDIKGNDFEAYLIAAKKSVDDLAAMITQFNTDHNVKLVELQRVIEATDLKVTQLATAIKNAETATAAANTATGKANTATTNANAATTAANTAKANADTATANANTATANADTATGKANTATTAANNAATAATTAKTNADNATAAATTATTNANAATTAANTAKTNADTATAAANTATGKANTATTAANTAKTNADIATAAAIQATTDADTATDLALASATKADTATTKANTAASNADTATGKANTAASNANAATTAATTATTNANNAAASVNTAKANAEAATTLANNAASAATTAKTETETATAKANTAASNADTATGKANTATTAANTAASSATTAASSANTAASAANKAATETAQLEHKGSYAAATQYKKRNVVEYNGSSFMALQDTKGNTPPVLPTTATAYWNLVAQRGIDGSGSIVTVNGKSPDVTGDVTIDTTALGAASTADLAAHMGDSKTHVTDAERTAWNAKASTAVATTSANGLMAAADKTKLNATATAADLTAHINDLVKHVTASERTAWNKVIADLTAHAGNKSNPHGVTTTQVNFLGQYAKKLADAATTYPLGLTTMFVQSEDGWQNYGTVLTARSHEGGTLQIYTPYGDSFGGTSLQYRTWKYQATAWSDWNSFETTAGAQAKATAVQTALNTHAANATHITAAERTAWNAKADGTQLNSHIADTTKHITAAERTAWNAKAGTAVATTSANGLMLAADKSKLDGVATGATKTIVENVLTSTSTANALSAAQGTALNTAVAAKAPIASPTFTGTPKAPTAAAGTNTTQLATTAFATTAASAALASAKEYAESLGGGQGADFEVETFVPTVHTPETFADKAGFSIMVAPYTTLGLTLADGGQFFSVITFSIANTLVGQYAIGVNGSIFQRTGTRGNWTSNWYSVTGKTATKYVLGHVKVGAGLDVTTEGTISVAPNAWTDLTYETIPFEGVARCRKTIDNTSIEFEINGQVYGAMAYGVDMFIIPTSVIGEIYTGNHLVDLTFIDLMGGVAGSAPMMTMGDNVLYMQSQLTDQEARYTIQSRGFIPIA